MAPACTTTLPVPLTATGPVSVHHDDDAINTVPPLTVIVAATTIATLDADAPRLSWPPVTCSCALALVFSRPLHTTAPPLDTTIAQFAAQDITDAESTTKLPLANVMLLEPTNEINDELMLPVPFNLNVDPDPTITFPEADITNTPLDVIVDPPLTDTTPDPAIDSRLVNDVDAATLITPEPVTVNGPDTASADEIDTRPPDTSVVTTNDAHVVLTTPDCTHSDPVDDDMPLIVALTTTLAPLTTAAPSPASAELDDSV